MMSVVELGRSWENRSIVAVKVSDARVNSVTRFIGGVVVRITR